MTSSLHDAERAVEQALNDLGNDHRYVQRHKRLRTAIRALADATRDAALRELRDVLLKEERFNDAGRGSYNAACIHVCDEIDAMLARGRKPAAEETRP